MRRTGWAAKSPRTAIGSDGIAAALRAGVNSIEHGDGSRFADGRDGAQNVYWWPTGDVGVHVARGRPWPALVPCEPAPSRRALRKGVKIALGNGRRGSPGPKSTRPKEFEYYVQYGMTPMQAIQSGSRRRGAASARSKNLAASAPVLRRHRRRSPGTGCAYHGTPTSQVRYEGGTYTYPNSGDRVGLVLFFGIGRAAPAWARWAPAGTGGVAALAGLLEQLGANKRVLVIGAHPDDEDTQLLVLCRRGWRAGGVSLAHRGEAARPHRPELAPASASSAPRKLLAARDLDGARQFFTREYDFGFSEIREEALASEPRDSLPRRRRCHPAGFRATGHRVRLRRHARRRPRPAPVAGLLARQAFDLLRDSTWGPVKFYRSTRFDSTATTLTLPSGTLDAVIGQSYYQLAMASRSRHRSQTWGSCSAPAEQRAGLLLSARATVECPTHSLPGWTPRGTGPGWIGYASLIDSARAALNPFRPGAVLPIGLARCTSRDG